MRTLIVPQRCIEDMLKASLLEDLSNVEEALLELPSIRDPFGYTLGDAHTANIKQHKKDIKTLKRAINFYSVEPPYENV